MWIRRFRQLGHYLHLTWLVIGGTLLMCVGVELVATVIVSLTTPPDVDARGHGGHQGAPWIADYNAESARGGIEWRPYVYWQEKPFSGKYINVDERGIRRTWTAPGADAAPRPFKIFMFGGSTMWGVGARDDYTIASGLARALGEQTARPVQVTNFGQTGYVSTQELLVLLFELERGNVPDLVIFYDGVNDTYAAFQNQTAGQPQNEANRRREFNLVKPERRRDLTRELIEQLRRESNTQKLIGRVGHEIRVLLGLPGNPYRVPESLQGPLVDDVLRAYAEHIDVVERLGRSYGFASLFYWQPDVFTKPKKSEYEEGQQATQFALAPFITAVHARLKQPPALIASSRFHDISDVFADEEQPLFIDFIHISETGNELVARRIAPDVLAVLDGAGTDRTSARP